MYKSLWHSEIFNCNLLCLLNVCNVIYMCPCIYTVHWGRSSHEKIDQHTIEWEEEEEKKYTCKQIKIMEWCIHSKNNHYLINLSYFFMLLEITLLAQVLCEALFFHTTGDTTLDTDTISHPRRLFVLLWGNSASLSASCVMYLMNNHIHTSIIDETLYQWQSTMVSLDTESWRHFYQGHLQSFQRSLAVDLSMM